MAGVKMSGLPLYRRALKQPHHMKKALQMMKDQGAWKVYGQIKGKLDAGMPIGYSAAGEVVAVGELVEGIRVGDRVACAGAGIANHAEIVDVPVNLCVKIPDSLSYDLAATVTLGAISMQGVRRAQPTLGESVVVIGLGILGQITAQLLQANGCRVIGTDIDSKRIDVARQNGMHVGLNPSDGDIVERIIKLTDGYGADSVIITAASPSDAIVAQAFQACRRKAKVILVGDVGLNLQRSDIYMKELDFLVSTSYGPGRYDANYEEGGQDYPIAYVRWTENRNMQEYIRLLGTGQVNLENMASDPYVIDDAARAYEALKGDGEKPLLVLLSYPERANVAVPTLAVSSRVKSSDKIGVAIIGAGGFAQAVHLPNIKKLPEYDLRMVVNRTGLSARGAADRFGAAVASTEFEAALSDKSVDLIMIATRHDLHGAMVLKALNAGKNVFVEKPLALTREELHEIAAFYQSHSNAPLLMTGFNRRFSPAMVAASKLLQSRTSPLIINYRMNAGYIPNDHWVHGPEGGGRNIGEACHIYDLFSFLTGGRPEMVSAFSTVADSQHWHRNDNFTCTVRYSDGSVCSLTYTSMGNSGHPKEQSEIFVDGKVLFLNDYKSLSVTGAKGGWSGKTIAKGQFEELQALAAALRGTTDWPITLQEQLDTAELAIAIEELIAQ
jgi:predicted dehydrogenase/threonine dehydrogenase-like Zn-dependent dehydrogenase